jgi:transposase
LPPDVREWLPEDHLAWFVIDAVGAMDLGRFYSAYREDGHGRAAHEPAMMVALLLYCWSRGTRSSRAIERACVENVACRVLTAHAQPDHATIARFIERHETAVGALFREVLTLCADAGTSPLRIRPLHLGPLGGPLSRWRGRRLPRARRRSVQILASRPRRA